MVKTRSITASTRESGAGRDSRRRQVEADQHAVGGIAAQRKGLGQADAERPPEERQEQQRGDADQARGAPADDQQEPQHGRGNDPDELHYPRKGAWICPDEQVSNGKQPEQQEDPKRDIRHGFTAAP